MSEEKAKYGVQQAQPVINESFLKEALMAGQKLAGVRFERITAGCETVLALVPDGIRIENLGRHILDRPDRKRFHATFSDAESFVAYLKEQGEPETRIFAQVSEKAGEALFFAIIDFQGNAPDQTSYMTHKAVLKLKKSRQWETWTELDNKRQNQEQFAMFLKNNRLDVKSPDASTLIEIAMTLEATTGSRCVGKVRTNKGVHIEYKEDISAKAGKDGSLDIPDTLKICIPVFEGAPRVDMGLDFAFSPNSGTPYFGYRILSAEEILNDAIKEVSHYIAKETGKTVFKGSVTA